jgi:hypothetical protein
MRHPPSRPFQASIRYGTNDLPSVLEPWKGLNRSAGEFTKRPGDGLGPTLGIRCRQGRIDPPGHWPAGIPSYSGFMILAARPTVLNPGLGTT